MDTYLDTNALARMFVPQIGSDPILYEDFQNFSGIPVTPLLRMETLNTFQRLVFEFRNRSPWRVTPEIVAVAKSLFEENLQQGIALQAIPLELHTLDPVFERITDQHVAKHGFRTYDILHVASALQLGCKKFLTFDKKAASLAKLEGLECVGV